MDTVEASQGCDATSLGLLYHENSKLRRGDARFGQRVAAFNQDPAIHAITSRPFKRYVRAPRVPLPSGVRKCSVTVDAALAQRRSPARFSPSSVDLSTVGTILWSGAGQVVSIQGAQPGVTVGLRTTPSAGALYPLETYLAAWRVTGLDPGLYHYDVTDHALDQLDSVDLRDRMSGICLRNLGETAGVVILSAMFRRSLAKYTIRGYRFVLMEAGHAAQNMLLTATAHNLAGVPLGGFYDDELSELMGLDGYEEAPLYVVAFGVGAETPVVGDRVAVGALERSDSLARVSTRKSATGDADARFDSSFGRVSSGSRASNR